ncbi:MAG: MBL fold metallo-hydrolase [Candidatus Micrarchaeota archaeon]
MMRLLYVLFDAIIFMASIIFLGTGGGRINLIRQLRGTGGFLIISKNLKIAIDPGPGALGALNSARLNPSLLDAIIITHCHIDHLLEAPLLIEAMSNYMLKKGGTLISPPSVVDGDENGDKSITTYHQSKLNQNIRLSAGEKKKIEIEKKGKKHLFSLEGVKVKHDDKKGFGFILEIDGKKISYTSDTEYLPAIHGKAYSGTDILIANLLKPAEDGIPDHLCTKGLISLLNSSNPKPKICLLTHMGMKLLRKNPELEASFIEKQAGVRTIAARDGWEYNIDNNSWGRYKKKKIQKKSKQKKLL